MQVCYSQIHLYVANRSYKEIKPKNTINSKITHICVCINPYSSVPDHHVHYICSALWEMFSAPVTLWPLLSWQFETIQPIVSAGGSSQATVRGKTASWWQKTMLLYNDGNRWGKRRRGEWKKRGREHTEDLWTEERKGWRGEVMSIRSNAVKMFSQGWNLISIYAGTYWEWSRKC